MEWGKSLLIWVEEIGYGILYLFLQPLFYITILLALVTGYDRVKRDRQLFGQRVFPRFAEWKKTVMWSILFGLLYSSLLVFTGAMISYEWTIVFSIVIVVLVLFNQVALLSPAYTVSITAIALFILNEINVTYPFIERALITDFELMSYLLIALLIVEMVLHMTTRRNRTFPNIHKGDRGKYIGSHLAKRLIVVPMFVPVPDGVLTLSPIFEWWPLLPLGSDGFSLMLVPFLLGFSQRFRGHFSEVGAKRVARWLSMLIVICVGLAVGAIYVEELTLAIFIVAIFGRLGIFLLIRFLDMEKRPIFTPRTDGMIVLGVIPNSPASEMNIQVGEIIEKVHDIPVTNEHEFFEVMSEHRTYCKLAIRNLDGETRFAQRPLYEGELHELGLIFVKETPRFKLKTETLQMETTE